MTTAPRSIKDHTGDVIAHHNKKNGLPNDTFWSCAEIHDWIYERCHYDRISDEVKPYVDWSGMLSVYGSDMKLYLRHKDTNTFEDITYWLTDSIGGKYHTRIRITIASGKRNLLFVLM